jgi:hypothetical protein
VLAQLEKLHWIKREKGRGRYQSTQYSISENISPINGKPIGEENAPIKPVNRGQNCS